MCICLLNNGRQCYELFSSIPEEVRIHLHLSHLQHSKFIGRNASFYSFPNIFFPFINIFLVEYAGIGKLMFFFTCAVIVGQSIIFLSLKTDTFSGIFLGNLIFGIGSESMAPIINTFVSTVLANDDISACLSVVSAFSRLGSCLCYVVSPYICRKWGVLTVFQFALGFCSLALFCAANCFLAHRKYLKIYPAHFEASNKLARTLDSLRTVFSHQKIVVLTFIFVFFANSYYGLVFFLSKILQQKYALTSKSAGLTIAMASLSSIVLLPLSGVLIDKMAVSRRHIIVATGASLACSFLLLGVSVQRFFVPVILHNAGYAFFGPSFWSCFRFILKEESCLYLAYCVTYGVCNLIYSLFMPFLGYCAVINPSYDLFFTILTTFILCGTLLALMLGDIGSRPKRVESISKVYPI